MNDDVDPAPDPTRPAVGEENISGEQDASGESIAYPDPAGLCRAVRRRTDASRREIADRTGLSRSTIARIVDPRPDEWWASIYGMARPPETFWRDRAQRDVQRARSQWEVRVAKFRSAPPPPTLDAWLRGRARQRALREERRQAGWPDRDP